MKKIVIWGTGKTSEEFIHTLSLKVEIIAYIDNFSNEKVWKAKPIYKLDEFLKMKIAYDYLIVASIYSNEIFAQCQDVINLKKIIFLYPFGLPSAARDIIFSHQNTIFLQEIASDYVKKWMERQRLNNDNDFPDSKIYENWKKNIEFKNKHNGERCFILGNGPSLSEIDLSKLENEIVFTTNFFNKVDKYNHAHTNYHFWIDGAFFNQRDDVKCDLEEIMECYHKISKENPICFVPINAANFIKKHKLEDILDIHYLRVKKSLDEYSQKGFEQEELDIALEIPAWRNVVQYAIEVAIYMGFKKIYLLGCNATCIMPVLDYFLQQDITELHVYRDDKSVKNITEGLFQNWKMSELFYDQYLVFWGYEKLYEYCLKRNIQLINCTSKTLINKIPKMDINKVIYI